MTTETSDTGAVFTARSPEDLLALVPAVLGFHPDESLVMLTFGGRRSFHARVDLPEHPRDLGGVAETLLVPALRQRPGTVVFIAYSADAVAAASAALAVSDAFDDHGFAVITPLRTDGVSWFRVRPGEDPARAEPHRYDVAAHALTAQTVLAGRVTLGSRAELAASVAADPEQAQRVAAVWRAQADGPAPDQREVRRLVARGMTGSVLSDHDIARLARTCLDPPVRDAAWCGLLRETAEEHLDFWRGVVVRIPDELVAGTAAVLGFTAWLAGHGALAWCAVDRARAGDKECSLATLVADLLDHAVPPTSWSPIADPGGAAKP